MHPGPRQRRPVRRYESTPMRAVVGPLSGIPRNIVGGNKDSGIGMFLTQDADGASHNSFATSIAERALTGKVEGGHGFTHWLVDMDWPRQRAFRSGHRG